MRVRSRSRSTTAISNKAFGYIFAVAGAMCIFAMISIIVTFRMNESKLPDDTQWYNGVITEVLLLDSRYEWREDSDGDEYKVKVYDAKAILEYEIEGEIYTYKYTMNGGDKPIKEGDRLFLQVSPSHPNTVYKVSTSTSNIGLYLGAGVFGIVGLIFVIVGLSIARSGKKRDAVYNNMNSQMYQNNMGNAYQPYNGGQPYNNAGYNNQGYSNQSYNNNDYYNNNQGTDYSGTSLRD